MVWTHYLMYGISLWVPSVSTNVSFITDFFVFNFKLFNFVPTWYISNIIYQRSFKTQLLLRQSQVVHSTFPNTTWQAWCSTITSNTSTYCKAFSWANIKQITVLFFPYSPLWKIQHCVWKIQYC